MSHEPPEAFPSHPDDIYADCQSPPVHTRPLPPPAQTDEPSVHDLVVADLADRKRFGVEKYGTVLQASNGRGHLIDAYQEALDLCCYLRAAIELRKREAPHD